MSLLTRTDASYKEWLQSLGQRWQQSQIKAAVKVNSELLRFNWALGRDIATLHMEAKYGSGFYQALSRDLQQLLPGAHSFSVTNLRYMRHFYEMYPDAGERQQLVGSSPADIRRHFSSGAVSNLQQLAGTLKENAVQQPDDGGVSIRQQLVDDLKENALQQSDDGAVSKFQQLAGDLKDEIIFYIPWGAPHAAH